MNWKIFFRKTHYWLAVVFFLPILIVIVTGLFIQVRKEVNWIQPSTGNGTEQYNPQVSMSHIFEVVKEIPQMEVSSWDDIFLLDMRPKKGLLKVRGNNRWEAQIDNTTGEVIQVVKRNNDWITVLHEGTWTSPFHSRTGPSLRLWVFLPASIAFLYLWGTGMYMYFFPYLSRRKGKEPRKIRNFKWKLFTRKIHHWISIVVALPLVIVIVTGIMLQVRYEVPWVYPVQSKGVGTTPQLTFVEIFERGKTVQKVGIREWEHVWRIFVYPAQGIATIRTNNIGDSSRMEIQVDHRTGKILHVVPRRTDIIEDFHEGNFLFKGMNLWIFFPAALITLLLLLSGGVLGLIPYLNKQKTKKQKTSIKV